MEPYVLPVMLSQTRKLYKPAFAAVHRPHSVFDIGHGTVIHCNARGVSLVDQWQADKNSYSFNWPITRWFLKLIKVGVIIEH